MSALPDPQVINLEVRVAHQEKTIDELSAVIADQWKEIDRLSKKLDALTSRFLTLEEASAPSIEITRPPHW